MLKYCTIHLPGGATWWLVLLSERSSPFWASVCFGSDSIRFGFYQIMALTTMILSGFDPVSIYHHFCSITISALR